MKLNPFVVMRQEPDGSGIVFDPENNKLMLLNASGVCLWEVFSRDGRIPEAVSALLLRFDGISAEQAEVDVQNFIDELSKRSLLVS